MIKTCSSFMHIQMRGVVLRDNVSILLLCYCFSLWISTYRPAALSQAQTKSFLLVWVGRLSRNQTIQIGLSSKKEMFPFFCVFWQNATQPITNNKNSLKFFYILDFSSVFLPFYVFTFLNIHSHLKLQSSSIRESVKCSVSPVPTRADLHVFYLFFYTSFQTTKHIVATCRSFSSLQSAHLFNFFCWYFKATRKRTNSFRIHLSYKNLSFKFYSLLSFINHRTIQFSFKRFQQRSWFRWMLTSSLAFNLEFNLFHLLSPSRASHL